MNVLFTSAVSSCCYFHACTKLSEMAAFHSSVQKIICSFVKWNTLQTLQVKHLNCSVTKLPYEHFCRHLYSAVRWQLVIVRVRWALLRSGQDVTLFPSRSVILFQSGAHTLPLLPRTWWPYCRWAQRWGTVIALLIWGKAVVKCFLKQRFQLVEKKTFLHCKGGEGGREGGMHLGSVTHIQDGFSFQKKKITKRWIEEAVIHSNTKQCGEMNNTDAKRVQACFYTVYGTVSTCHSFCHNYSIKSLLVCTIQGFSSRIYSDLLLYLITGLLGVCIMVV